MLFLSIKNKKNLHDFQIQLKILKKLQYHSKKIPLFKAIEGEYFNCNYKELYLTVNNIQKFLLKNKAKLVNKNFSYNSRSNPKFLNVSEIRQMLKKEKLI